MDNAIFSQTLVVFGLLNRKGSSARILMGGGKPGGRSRRRASWDGFRRGGGDEKLAYSVIIKDLYCEDDSPPGEMRSLTKTLCFLVQGDVWLQFLKKLSAHYKTL